MNNNKPKFQYPRFIRICKEGYEVYINPDGSIQGLRSGDRPKGMITRARNYIKGLKKVWKDEPGFFENAGSAYTGRIDAHEERYNKIVRQLNEEQIVAIGLGAKFEITSYVDGSYPVQVNENNL